MRLVVSHTVSVVFEYEFDGLHSAEEVASLMSDNLSIACGSIHRDLKILGESDNVDVTIRSVTSRPVAS